MNKRHPTKGNANLFIMILLWKKKGGHIVFSFGPEAGVKKRQHGVRPTAYRLPSQQPQLRERERGSQNSIHKNSQRILYSVFWHAARLLHAPRRVKIHVPAHLTANCSEVCLRILLCIKFPLALAEIPSPLTRKKLMHMKKNKNILWQRTQIKTLSRPDADTSGTQEKI